MRLKCVDSRRGVVSLRHKRLSSLPRALALVAGRREQITAAADGANHRGLGRIDLDLAPDPHDTKVDRAVERFGVARIGEFEQPLARQHPLGVGREHFQEPEFGRRQRVLVAFVVAQRLRLEIEPFGAEPHQLLLVRLGASGFGAAFTGALRRRTERMRAINSRSSQGFAM